jgi:hypothetical protein
MSRQPTTGPTAFDPLATTPAPSPRPQTPARLSGSVITPDGRTLQQEVAPVAPAGEGLLTPAASGPTPRTAALFDDLRQSDPAGASRLAAAVAALPEVGNDFLGFHLVGELGRGAFGRVTWPGRTSWPGAWLPSR